MSLDLNAIRARADAATEGPWYFGGDTAVAQEMFQNHELIVSPTYPIIEFEPGEQGEADAEFVAHARTDVVALLAEVEQLSSLFKAAVDAHGQLVDELAALRRGGVPATPTTVQEGH